MIRYGSLSLVDGREVAAKVVWVPSTITNIHLSLLRLMFADVRKNVTMWQ
jgi:hypothetical protein